MRRIFRLLQQNERIFAGMSVLEIGCSDLFFQVCACEIGIVPKAVLGVDVFWEDTQVFAQQNARALGERFGVDISLMSTHAESILTSSRFELAVALETLEHVHDEKAVLSQISSHLSPTGHLLLSIPVEFGVMAFAKELARFAITGKTRYTRSEFWSLLMGRTKEIARIVGDHKGYDYRSTIHTLRTMGFAPVHEEHYPVSTADLAYGYIGLWRRLP